MLYILELRLIWEFSFLVWCSYASFVLKWMDSLSSFKFMVCANSYIERLLDRISNGVLAEDRRSAMDELRSVVPESQAAQLAFGAMGDCFSLPVEFVSLPR